MNKLESFEMRFHLTLKLILRLCISK